jgi:hypothetical protein
VRRRELNRRFASEPLFHKRGAHRDARCLTRSVRAT